nr:hypothetical protein [Sphaerochaetaceae bacterium]
SIVDLSSLPDPYIIMMDDESLFYLNDRLILPEGKNVIRVIPYEKEEKIITLNIEAGKIAVISDLFEKIHTAPLTIASVPYGADIEILGDSYKAPFYLEEAPKPTILTVSNPGFKTSVLQLNDDKQLYTSYLRPEWSGKEGEVKNSKKRLYKAIRNTLLALGANSIVRASYAIWPERKNELRPLNAITLGFGVMGILSIFHSGYNYYSTAKDTYLQE